MTQQPRLAAVVLTGGTAVRLDGADKASIEIDGTTLLEHALAATVTAEETVVVGGQLATSRPVTWTREDPSGGGPAAGVLAGLDALARPPALALVLAVDMPRVTAGTFERLLAAVASDPGTAGALLVDESGRRQPLAAVYRYDALSAARPADPAEQFGLPLYRLVGALSLAEVPAVGPEARDVDTWEDLRDLRSTGRGRPF